MVKCQKYAKITLLCHFKITDRKNSKIEGGGGGGGSYISGVSILQKATIDDF